MSLGDAFTVPARVVWSRAQVTAPVIGEEKADISQKTDDGSDCFGLLRRETLGDSRGANRARTRTRWRCLVKVFHSALNAAVRGVSAFVGVFDYFPSLKDGDVFRRKTVLAGAFDDESLVPGVRT